MTDTRHVLPESRRSVLLSDQMTMIDATAAPVEHRAVLLDRLEQIDALLEVIHKDTNNPHATRQLAAIGALLAEQAHALAELDAAPAD